MIFEINVDWSNFTAKYKVIDVFSFTIDERNERIKINLQLNKNTELKKLKHYFPKLFRYFRFVKHISLLGFALVFNFNQHLSRKSFSKLGKIN